MFYCRYERGNEWAATAELTPGTATFFPGKKHEDLTLVQKHMVYFDHPVGPDGLLRAPCIYARHKALKMTEDMPSRIKMAIKAETIPRLAPGAMALSMTFNPAATGLWSSDGTTLPQVRWDLLQELAVLDHNGVWVVTNHASHAMSAQPLAVKFPDRTFASTAAPASASVSASASASASASSPPGRSPHDIAALFVTWDMVTNQGSIPEEFDIIAPGWVWWPTNFLTAAGDDDFGSGAAGSWQRALPVHVARQFYEDSLPFFKARAAGSRAPPMPTTAPLGLPAAAKASYVKARRAFQRIAS
jgi:hypothetical protein